VLIALGASLPGLGNEFAYDDIALIQENARVHGFSRIGEILTSPYWPPPFREDLYRPLAALLSAFEYMIGAGTPLAFRLTSYGLYALCALLVYRFAQRIVSPAAAAAAALLFAAHPAHVEAVALGVNQGELLVGIAALLAVTLYVDKRRANTLRPADWGILCMLYAAAALSKENGFALPGLLLAAECFAVKEGTFRERARFLAPGYAGLAVVGVGLLGVRAAVLSGDVVGAFANEAFVGLDASNRILTMIAVAPTALRILSWPAHLQVDYGPDEIVASTSFGPAEIVGTLAIAGLVAVGLAARRSVPSVTLGLLWCAVAFAPVSNVLVPTSIIISERTLFLASVGWIIAIVAAVDALIARWPKTGEVAYRTGQPSCSWCWVRDGAPIGRRRGRMARAWVGSRCRTRRAASACSKRISTRSTP
jgi:hypothetical protein